MKFGPKPTETRMGIHTRKKQGTRSKPSSKKEPIVVHTAVHKKNKISQITVSKIPAIQKQSITYTARTYLSIRTAVLFTCGVVVFLSILTFTGTRIILTYVVDTPIESTSSRDIAPTTLAHVFPIGVDPKAKTITENPQVDAFFKDAIESQSIASRVHTNWFQKLLSKLVLFNIYQNIASPTGRILVIDSGERKEEVVNNFAKILHWNTAEKEVFVSKVIATDPQILEGKFMPATYLTSKDASPDAVAQLVTDTFTSAVLSRYSTDIEDQVPLADTLTIASLLEREAYDFEDMRLISGIIWNRLFSGMNLQIDATLQYAKGTHSSHAWWPRVIPSDKYIESPFNTYKNTGLPPAPIANPSVDAILAALNPRKTDCMYYFHDADAGFHCSVTYEAHVTSLKEYYGRGK